MRTRTLAHVTSWAPERIEALRRPLKGEFDGLSGDLPPTGGPIWAVRCGLQPLAARLGRTRGLGKERLAQLALCRVLVRVAAQGSRLSAVRWAATHAVAETLGLGRVDDTARDAAWEALAPRQAQLAAPLDHRVRRQTGPSPTVGLYDVPAADVEGECPARAACGDHRDQTPGKAQIVLGVMPMAEGEPVAGPVFEGHPADPLTVPAPVETRSTRFGRTAVVCVGARGLVTTNGKAARATAGSKAIPALPPPRGVSWCARGSDARSG